VCEACTRSGGFLLPCDKNNFDSKKKRVIKCSHFFHPLCAAIATYKCTFRGGVKYYYCADHSFDKDAECRICRKANRLHEMLECDMCKGGYHMDCISPSLKELPEAEWYCSSCAQTKTEQENGEIFAKSAHDNFCSSLQGIENEKYGQNSNKRKNQSIVAIEDGAEKYFEKKKAKVTSSRSTSRRKEILKSPTDVIDELCYQNDQKGVKRKKDSASRSLSFDQWPTPQEVVIAMGQKLWNNDPLIEKLENSFCSSFSKWIFLLKSNRSIILHGYGSKRNVLDMFAKEASSDGYVAKIQCYE